jgi:hypothetical protein
VIQMDLQDFRLFPDDSNITPASVARRRQLAQALMQEGSQTTPVVSPWQGAARVAQALAGTYKSRRADAVETEKQGQATAALQSALGSKDVSQIAAALGNPWNSEGAKAGASMLVGNMNQQAQLAQSAQFHRDQMAQQAAQLQLQRELADKGQFTQIGMDAYGQPMYGVFQPKSGAVTPYGGANAGMAGGQGGTAPVPSGGPAPSGPVVGGIPLRPGEDLKAARETVTKHNVQQALDAPQQMQGVVNMIDMIDSTLGDPGLETATGWASKFPTFPGSDAANFETRHQQLMGKSLEQGISFLQGKGAMSDAEGKAAREGFSRLSLKLSSEDYKKALGEVRGLMTQSLERLKAQSRGAPVPTPPSNADGGGKPMYAVNPQTKQRIMSLDGGKTWQQAQ